MLALELPARALRSRCATIANVSFRPPTGGVEFGAALRTWLYVGLNSFGGPAGQIAVLHREIVERRAWLSERRFLHALNYCMLLPGPEAQQLATYVGWLLNGVRGGLAAGILFVLPGVAAIMALSILYAGYHDVALVQALFYGIKPAVVAVVAAAVLRIGQRAIGSWPHGAIAAGAFIAIYFFDVAFPLIILGAALAGWLIGRLRPTEEPASDAQPAADSARPALRRSLLVLAIGLTAWLGPVALLVVWLGPANVYSQLGTFFSTAAVVTFGGAYAVLAYVAQQAVDVFGWLSPGQMLDGLGMAESTPGPLIMVVQFVGFMGAFRQAGALDPLMAGALGGLLVSWVTFVPSFLWIFLGAPYAEYLRGRPGLAAAMSGITAAVVGVMANLAIWFALQTLFAVTGEVRPGPVRLHTVDASTLDLAALALAVLALVALTRLRWPLLLTFAASAAAGVAWRLFVVG
jgi:chromate transporter